MAGLGWFIAQIPGSSSKSDTSELIVVLTGGSGRLEHGLNLLAEGKGKQLFISGVHSQVAPGDLLRQADREVRDRIAALPSGSIVLGREAYNTIGNAEETARLLVDKNYRSIRLVTSAYHMPRSISEFGQVMPGVTLSPEPVYAPDEFPAANWWQYRDSWALVMSEYHKFLAGKLRHFLLPARS